MNLARAALVTLVMTGCVRSQPVVGHAEKTLSRADQIVEANVRAGYAHHVLLAKKEGKGDPHCYAAPNLAAADLEAVVAHERALLATDPAAVRAWIAGEPSAFDPSRDVAPILGAPLDLPQNLPVNVVTRSLARASGKDLVKVRSIASLYETVLELDRDGDVLQQQFDFYIALNLPVYVGQIGLPGTDAAFLEMGKSLAAESCASPFDTDPAAYQIAGRKLWNWGEKHLHVRDKETLATELLQEPDVQALLPALRALPAQRIAVLGHSFTMDVHWATPSSFTEIAAAVLHRVNPGIVVTHFSDGGLGAARAETEFYPRVQKDKPTQVLVVLLYRKDEDYEALRRMLAGFATDGVRAHLFDNVREPSLRDREMVARVQAIAKTAQVPCIEVSARLASAKDKDRFVCLDGIHMTEPYHRFMAKEWLRFLATPSQ